MKRYLIGFNQTRKYAVICMWYVMPNTNQSNCTVILPPIMTVLWSKYSHKTVKKSQRSKDI